MAGSYSTTGAQTIGRVPRGDGGAVFVTWREAPLDTTRLEAPAEMFEGQWNHVNAGSAAMLVLPNDDESWRVVEGPVEPTGPVRVKRGVRPPLVAGEGLGGLGGCWKSEHR